MKAAVDLDQAVRLRRAETEWLQQCGARLRAAARRPDTEPVPDRWPRRQSRRSVEGRSER